MSKPDIEPKQSVAGIAVDPKTLERVIPESRRPDGSVRKQMKVRPGFTPQEDVSRFRGSRQQQLDRNALPRGHILGWIAPSSDKNAGAAGAGIGAGASAGAAAGSDKPLTKSAAKNAKRKAKKQAEKEKVIQENWEDSDEERANGAGSQRPEEAPQGGQKDSATANETPETAAAGSPEGDALADELERKLDVH